jgi:hypothetical protein
MSYQCPALSSFLFIYLTSVFLLISFCLFLFSLRLSPPLRVTCLVVCNVSI